MREGFVCTNCSASSRHRAVVYTIGKCMGTAGISLALWSKNKAIRILESSGRGSYPMMLKDKFTYYNTEYHPDPSVTQHPSKRYADFQHLAYCDNEFDYVIASDVFEHIREDEKAFCEIYRILKPEGIFIMTVPYQHNWEQTEIRIRPEGNHDEFLLPPEYHGGGGQTLSYRTYGRDLLQRLKDYGFTVGCLELEVPQYAIVRQFIFICVKSCYLDLGKFHTESIDETFVARVKASPLWLFRLFVVLKYNMISIRHFVSEVFRQLSEKIRR